MKLGRHRSSKPKHLPGQLMEVKGRTPDGLIEKYR
jgi:hypothetical protein